MSIVRRIALVLKSYFAATSDRLDRIAEEEERREIESRRKALEELKSMQASAETVCAGQAVREAPRVSPEVERLAADYRLLGLKPGADLNSVEAAWRNLASRADPKRFASGSNEEKRAAELLRSINAAYARIREALNPTEGRFGRLEL